MKTTTLIELCYSHSHEASIASIEFAASVGMKFLPAFPQLLLLWLPLLLLLLGAKPVCEMSESHSWRI